MKAFPISMLLLVIGICSAVPQMDLSPADIISSIGSEGSEIATIAPSEDNEIVKKENRIESRKKQGGMEQMYMMFMMCKSILSTMMMLLQPIFQVKALGISFVGMLINLARFVMQVKQSKTGGGGQGFGATGLGGGLGTGAGSVWAGQDRIGSSLPQTYQPNYITRYTISE